MTIKISYIPGKDENDSLFICKEGNREYKVTLKEIVPDTVIELMKRDDPRIKSVDEVLEELQAKITSVDHFKRWARKQRRKKRKQLEVCPESTNLCPEEKIEKTKKSSILERIRERIKRKAAEFSLNPAEVSTEAVKSGPTVSLKEDEVDKDVAAKAPSKESDAGRRIKDFFNKLPNDRTQEVIRSLNPEETVTARLVEKLKAELKKKEEELERLKKEKDNQEKLEKIYKIVSELKAKNYVMPDNEDKIIQNLAKLDIKSLDTMIETISMLEQHTITTSEVTKNDNIPQIYSDLIHFEDAEKKLSQIWNK
jgi:hypothetical protein